MDASYLLGHLVYRNINSKISGKAQYLLISTHDPLFDDSTHAL